MCRSPNAALAANEIAMNSQQRKCGSFVLGQALDVAPFVPTSEVRKQVTWLVLFLFLLYVEGWYYNEYRV